MVIFLPDAASARPTRGVSCPNLQRMKMCKYHHVRFPSVFWWIFVWRRAPEDIIQSVEFLVPGFSFNQPKLSIPTYKD